MSTEVGSEERKETTGKSPEALFLEQMTKALESVDDNDSIGSYLLGYVNGSIEGFQKKHSDEIACRKGCNHCCKFMVAVSSAEAIAIYRYLQLTRSPAKLLVLKVRLEERVKNITGLTAQEYWEKTHEKGCLFLNKEGACTIYSSRPRACSSMLVRDATPCIEHHETLMRHETPMNMSIIGYMALSKVLRDRKLQSGMYELNSALLTLFQDSTAVERWSKGEEVFKGNMAPELDNRIHLEVFNGDSSAPSTI